MSTSSVRGVPQPTMVFASVGLCDVGIVTYICHNVGLRCDIYGAREGTCERKKLTRSHDLVSRGIDLLILGDELFVISVGCPFECNIGAREGTFKRKKIVTRGNELFFFLSHVPSWAP